MYRLIYVLKLGKFAWAENLTQIFAPLFCLKKTPYTKKNLSASSSVNSINIVTPSHNWRIQTKYFLQLTKYEWFINCLLAILTLTAFKSPSQISNLRKSKQSHNGPGNASFSLKNSKTNDSFKHLRPPFSCSEEQS